MNRVDNSGRFRKGDGCTVSALATGKNCSMVFLLPDQGHSVDEFLNTPEQLETILDKKESDAESTKIGVYNVNERLQLFFGPDAVMKYYSTPGVRTMVMLVLPIVRGKEEDSHAED